MYYICMYIVYMPPPIHEHTNPHTKPHSCTQNKKANNILYLNIAEYPKLQWMLAYIEDHILLDYLRV